MTESIWTHYRVRWDFLTKLCGQTPADPKIISKWLEARQPNVKPPGAKSISEINEEVFDSISHIPTDEEAEYSRLVFQRNSDGHLVMRSATVKAHIKDCARVLSNQYIGKIKGERAFSTRVINGVYPDERQYWIPIIDSQTGKPKTEADGEYEKPIHVRGARGETMNAIKCFEYVEGVSMNFVLKVLTSKGGTKDGKPTAGKPSVHLADLETVFQYGGVHGYAGERSDGEGRYIYEIEEINVKQGKGKKRAA